MNARRARVLDAERRLGARDIQARRAFNRALAGGRVALKRSPGVTPAGERGVPAKKGPAIKKRTKKRSPGGVAVKNDPALWERAKEKACSEGRMCKHSARKMQWAVHYYKSHGGTYAGKKSASNKLHQWTTQKWRTASGEKSGGKLRYLPAEAWKHLTREQVEDTNRSKQKGYARGKQWVKQPKDVARVAKKYRRLKPASRKKK
jgi:hypothetical protein